LGDKYQNSAYEKLKF